MASPSKPPMGGWSPPTELPHHQQDALDPNTNDSKNFFVKQESSLPYVQQLEDANKQLVEQVQYQDNQAKKIEGEVARLSEEVFELQSRLAHQHTPRQLEDNIKQLFLEQAQYTNDQARKQQEQFDRLTGEIHVLRDQLAHQHAPPQPQTDTSISTDYPKHQLFQSFQTKSTLHPLLFGNPNGLLPPPTDDYQVPPQPAFDTTGQEVSPGRPRVTAIWWEGGITSCYQVEAKGVVVARRQDNRWINGTKLLIVSGMTRGRRDTILALEKASHVVTIAPMHMKGVWIPFERALYFANREKIAEILYPLFADGIGAELRKQEPNQIPKARASETLISDQDPTNATTGPMSNSLNHYLVSSFPPTPPHPVFKPPPPTYLFKPNESVSEGNKERQVADLSRKAYIDHSPQVYRCDFPDCSRTFARFYERTLHQKIHTIKKTQLLQKDYRLDRHKDSPSTRDNQAAPRKVPSGDLLNLMGNEPRTPNRFSLDNKLNVVDTQSKSEYHQNIDNKRRRFDHDDTYPRDSGSIWNYLDTPKRSENLPGSITSRAIIISPETTPPPPESRNEALQEPPTTSEVSTPKPLLANTSSHSMDGIRNLIFGRLLKHASHDVDHHNQNFYLKDANARRLINEETKRYKVSYRVNWKIKEFMMEQFGSLTTTPLGSVIALVGTATCAQATTVREYLNTTWPVTGQLLLHLIQKKFEPWSIRSQKSYEKQTVNSSAMEYQNFRIFEAHVNFPDLVMVWGSQQFIVEIGQQIAWLGAALRASENGQIGLSRAEFLTVEDHPQPYQAPVIPPWETTTTKQNTQKMKRGRPSNAAKAQRDAEAIASGEVIAPPRMSSLREETLGGGERMGERIGERIRGERSTYPPIISSLIDTTPSIHADYDTYQPRHLLPIAPSSATSTSPPSARPSSNQSATPPPQAQENLEVLEFDVHFIVDSLSDGQKSCWHDLFVNPVVVHGFPIPNRGEEIGLEIPIQMMAALGGVSHAIEYEGGLVMKGFSSMFVPLSCSSSGNSIQWHFICNEDDERLEYSQADKQCPGRALLNKVDHESLTSTRAFLGWWGETVTRLGTADVNYNNIDWSATKEPDRAATFSGGTVGFQNMAVGQLNFNVAPKDNRFHISRSRSFQNVIKYASGTPVVLYDTCEKRGWLVPSSAVIAHIIQTRNFREPFSINGKVVDIIPTHPTQNVYEAAKNMLLVNGPTKVQVDEAESTIVYFRDVVLGIWTILDFIMERDIKKKASAEPTVHVTTRKSIQGWEFMDLVEEISPLGQKETEIEKSCGDWPDLVQDINAIVLFASGFEDLIMPDESLRDGLCHSWRTVPKDKHYLAASVPMLNSLYEKAGSRLTRKHLSSKHLQWHRGPSLFEGCENVGAFACKCDRLQRIVHESTMSFGTVTPPGILEEKGAVIFGQAQHSLRTPVLTHAKKTKDVMYSQGQNLPLALKIDPPKSPGSDSSNDWDSSSQTALESGATFTTSAPSKSKDNQEHELEEIVERQAISRSLKRPREEPQCLTSENRDARRNRPKIDDPNIKFELQEAPSPTLVILADSVLKQEHRLRRKAPFPFDENEDITRKQALVEGLERRPVWPKFQNSR